MSDAGKLEVGSDGGVQTQDTSDVVGQVCLLEAVRVPAHFQRLAPAQKVGTEAGGVALFTPRQGWKQVVGGEPNGNRAEKQDTNSEPWVPACYIGKGGDTGIYRESEGGISNRGTGYSYHVLLYPENRMTHRGMQEEAIGESSNGQPGTGRTRETAADGVNSGVSRYFRLE